MSIGRACRAYLLGMGCGMLLAAGTAAANPQEDLIDAAVDGESSDIEAAVEAGANVNEAHKGGWTALMIAAELNDAEVVGKLLEEGAKIDAKRQQSGFTPLMVAAEHNDPEVIKTLIEAGADIEARDNENWTALMLAAAWNEPAAAQVLLDAGANTEARTNNGSTALMFAARNNNEAMIETLIDGGADVNAQNGWGFSILMAASYANEPQVVDTLLQAGADPTLTDRNDYTAADWGKRNSRVHDTDVYYAMRDAEEEAEAKKKAAEGEAGKES